MAFFWCAFFHWIQLGCEVMMAFSIFRNVAVSFVSCRIRRILVHLFFAFNHIYPALCLGSLNSTSSELETWLGVDTFWSLAGQPEALCSRSRQKTAWRATSLSELPDNKGLAPTYLSLWYTFSYWRNAYYTHKCSFTRPYLPGLHILESLLAIDRPVTIQISLAWSSALTLDI